MKYVTYGLVKALAVRDSVPEAARKWLGEIDFPDYLDEEVPAEHKHEELIGFALALSENVGVEYIPEEFHEVDGQLRLKGSFSDFYDLYHDVRDLSFEKFPDNPSASGLVSNIVATWQPVFLDCGCSAFKYELRDENAVPPTKVRTSDSGYDLTLLSVVDRKGPITFYDTGVAVAPFPGTYFDLVPRSSLAKSGYMLANSVGVLDMGYTGNIIVALVKVWDEAPELELPMRAVQIIPRNIAHYSAFEVDKIEDTERADGGFGSTD